MNTPTIAANTYDRNEPLPTATSATGTMMNTDDAGVTPDSVMKTLPRMPIDRLRSCSYRAASGAPAAASAPALTGPPLVVSSICMTSRQPGASTGRRRHEIRTANLYPECTECAGLSIMRGQGRRRASSLQRLPDGRAERAGDRRGEGVAHLAVRGRLAAGKGPAVREPLQAGDHGHGQLGRLAEREVRAGGAVGHAETVHAERRPGLAGAGGAQVGAAVFLASADDGGRDAARPRGPGVRPRPAARRHQVVQRVADGGRAPRRGGRPAELRSPRAPEGDQHEPGAQLWHPMLARPDLPPPGLVAQHPQAGEDLDAVAVEAPRGQAAHVLQQHRPGPGLADQAERGREQVTVVAGPELPAGDGERRAGDAAGQQVEAGEAAPVLVADVALDDLPFHAAVEAEGLAGVRVELHHGLVCEAGLFQAERLPAGPGADLQRRQPVHDPSSLLLLPVVCPPAPP